jgi:hypothetical protein
VGLYKNEKKILGNSENNLKTGHQVPYKLGYFFITLGQPPLPKSPRNPCLKKFFPNFFGTLCIRGTLGTPCTLGTPVMRGSPL